MTARRLAFGYVRSLTAFSACAPLEQPRDDRRIDLLAGIELVLGGAVFEVELHDRVEDLVELARLAAVRR